MYGRAVGYYLLDIAIVISKWLCRSIVIAMFLYLWLPRLRVFR